MSTIRNMTSIIYPNVDTFPFDKLKILPPLKCSGAAYITKIEYNHKPLYIQTCKSKTKQGIVKSGKKQYCDLMFDSTSEEFIQWIEHLENHCQECIFSKSKTWFTSDLDRDDIENAFISPLRLYKSGKFYLLKAQVLATSGGYDLKVFDEQQKQLSTDDITDTASIISILEIQGIKFCQNKFQLEIILKSVMVINENPSFNECLFNLKTNDVVNIKQSPKEKEEKEEVMNNSIVHNGDVLLIENPMVEEKKEEPITIPEVHNDNNNIQVCDLKEVDEIFPEEDVDKKQPVMKIKERNEIYMKLYQDAKKEAKRAKKEAIKAYMKAKKIKDNYLSDLDEDSVSEEEEEEKHEK